MDQLYTCIICITRPSEYNTIIRRILETEKETGVDTLNYFFDQMKMNTIKILITANYLKKNEKLRTAQKPRPCISQWRLQKDVRACTTIYTLYSFRLCLSYVIL